MSTEKIDFFIHPDFHKMAGNPITEAYKQYEADLKARIVRAEIAVLIFNTDTYIGEEDASKSDFWNLFYSELRIPTIPGDGILASAEGAERALGLTEGAERVLVHGSYAGSCVHRFAQHLQIARAVDDSDALCRFDKLGYDLSGVDWAAQTPVELGSTLTNSFGESDNVKLALVEDKLPHLTTFIGEETRVFSSPRYSFNT